MRAVWDKSAGVNLTQGAPGPGQAGQAGLTLSFVPKLPSLLGGRGQGHAPSPGCSHPFVINTILAGCLERDMFRGEWPGLRFGSWRGKIKELPLCGHFPC